VPHAGRENCHRLCVVGDREHQLEQQLATGTCNSGQTSLAIASDAGPPTHGLEQSHVGSGLDNLKWDLGHTLRAWTAASIKPLVLKTLPQHGGEMAVNTGYPCGPSI
jgi:hypothetical protein